MNTQEGRYKGAANAITGIRIVCSAALLCCLPFSPAFYALYLIAGATDVLDGAVARATHTISELGSSLDTVADLTFLAVCLVKLIPVLPVERWMMIWMAGIAATGRTISFEALEHFRVADGKIVESWGYWPDKEIEEKLR